MTAPRDVPVLVRTALDEDLGTLGDLTSAATIDPDAVGRARLVARADGVISGTAFVRETFAQVDPRVEVELVVADGARVRAGDLVARLAGPSRSLLTGERVVLNFVGLLSGVASATARLVDLVDGTGTVVVDTRKTVPGLRAAQKRAVRHGGGANHRFGLDDAVMVKDNHIGLAGGLRPALERLGRRPGPVGHLTKVEVEVDTLDQLAELLAVETERTQGGLPPVVDVVLLDNMTPPQVSEAVAAIRASGHRIVVEVSGGVTEQSVRALAEAGADVISAGALTHSAPWLDVALDLDPVDLAGPERTGG